MSVSYPKTVLYAKNGKSYYFRHKSIFKLDGIARIEEMKTAVYVCDTCLKGRGGWVNNPVAVFWNKDPANIPDGGSAWFGMFYRAEYPDPDAPIKLFITNAISATQDSIDAVVATDGEVVWSRFRHDMRYSQDGSVWIDGGRDYMRWSGSGETVRLRIVDGELTIVENWETRKEQDSA